MSEAGRAADQGLSGLREAEARNRQILDSAVDYAIIALDTEGRITRWNEGAHRVLGWTEEEALGQSAERIFTPEDRAAGRLQKEIGAALMSGAGNDERWHVRKSGERFWANGEMTPIRGVDDSVTGFVKVLRDRTAEHRAAQALKDSEARLHRAQAAGGVGTFTVDISTDRLFGTREFYRIFGLPDTESMPASRLEVLVLPEDAHIRSSSAARQEESAELDVEYRIRRASDGAVRWIARKAEFERDTAGRTRMHGVVQDITDRKATQQGIEDSAAQFRTFAQVAPNHVWTAPASGQLDWFNDRVYEYSGAKPGELDGDRWVSLLHPDDVGVAGARWAESVASGAGYETEFRIRRADGEYRWHLVRALPHRDGAGEITRWIGTNTDIHEHKLVQAKSTHDLHRLWTLSQELMLVCDFDGRIVDVNPAATRLLGWTREEMIGRPVNEFIHPDDVAPTQTEIARISGGATTLSFENRYQRRDGEHQRLSWTAVPDAGVIHAVARDVTRERAAEEALRQSQKLEAIGQLTGGVAHDFNNVLAVVRTSIDLLRRLPLADERRHRFMEAISNAVSRATKLTGQLLAFARRQALQPTVFDVAQNTSAVAEMVGTLTGARIGIDLQLPDQSCFVYADPSQFDTALVNLAVNARDAMSGSGTLVITVRAVSAIPGLRAHPPVPGPFVTVSIADSGSGISPQNLVKIFEPFFTTKAAGQGTGLGLSQVFGFAKQSGGDIDVESTLGAGSRFTLYLPRVPRPGHSAEGVSAEGELPLGNGGRILVVEDNPEVAGSVENTLLELGYSTLVVASAEKALAELQSNAARFVAVFSDVVMSGMNGIELGNEIRRRYGALPVVLSSGYSYVLAQNPNHGFALLPKPYSLEDLARVLHESIVKKRALRASPRVALEQEVGAQLVHHEALRQAELDSMQILDTEDDAAYDELTRLAADFFKAPIALISLVDADRQWFKARVGLQARETPREYAFCSHAIQNPDSTMIVTDAREDERFAANPLVTGDPNIRFYAGAPLLTSAGYALGTLCVIDSEPRAIEPGQMEVLQALAKQVVRRLEERRAKIEADAHLRDES